ncbi:hypothetical protein P280DRAFT_10451 [Massarina eburnea CBS 473.64]|uniref:Osmotin, thaumatin-like protein n=1 Tax=Massarina eburnea CBS 473.64 TaxID=1395130 RepID=A0A6A6SF10_9PLEO|nr:hypothetical protein P280DRAFT_10451 [Massarina eburnea CBS 473.64]
MLNYFDERGSLLLVMNVLLAALLAQAVRGCADITVTETVWVTATNVASGVSSLASTSSSLVVVPTSTPPLPVTSSLSTTTVLPTSQTGGPGPSATYNPLPLPAIAKTASPHNFNALVNREGLTVIHNSCNYTLFLTVNPPQCGGIVHGHEIAAGETYTEPIRSCPDDSGISLQITSKVHTKPILVEYSERNGISYDLSFIDCLEKTTTNMSGCAGWDEGHQCGSASGCPVFACQPGEYCDRTSYTIPEYGLTEANKDERNPVPAPVGWCKANSGIVWEICAGSQMAMARKYSG